MLRERAHYSFSKVDPRPGFTDRPQCENRSRRETRARRRNAQAQSMAGQPFARLTRATVTHGCNPSGTVGFDFQWLDAEAKTMDIMMRRIGIGLMALTIATAGLTVSAPALPGGSSIGVAQSAGRGDSNDVDRVHFQRGPGFQSFLPWRAPS